MSWLQAILIGLMSCTAASTIACLGTTVGNYTLNRPLVASLFVGLILGDVSRTARAAANGSRSFPRWSTARRTGSMK